MAEHKSASSPLVGSERYDTKESFCLPRAHAPESPRVAQLVSCLSPLSHKPPTPLSPPPPPPPPFGEVAPPAALMPSRLRPPIQSLRLRGGTLPQPSLSACTQPTGEQATETQQNAAASRQAPPPGPEAACTLQSAVFSDTSASRGVDASRSTKWAVGAARRRSPESAGGESLHDGPVSPSFLFEAKPGGRMHLKARQRLFALAAGAPPVSASSEDVTSGHADAPTAGLVQDVESAAPVPLMEHRPAAARRRQLETTRGALVRALSMHALLVHGTPAERAGVCRHLSGVEEVRRSDPLSRILYRAELESYLRFLVSYLPSLELQTLLAAFTEASLHAMATEQMEELLQLLHLGERPQEGGQQGPLASRSSSCCCGSEAKPAVPPPSLQHEQAARLPPDSQEGLFTSYGPKTQQLKSSSSSSSSCCSCSGSGSLLTSEGLLRILKCTDPSQAACLPPCLKANTTLRQLLRFVHPEHPLLKHLKTLDPKVTASASCVHQS
ncbi:hypothetical protein Emed_001363 [Eimeria media]